MKNGLLYYLLFFAIISQAQTTAIPDSNFEQALIDLGYDNIIDGQVLTANINTVTTLNVSFSNITDLTGIEDFSALTFLNCLANSIVSINLSNNTSLEILELSANQLTTIDLSSNVNLTELYLSQNQLTNLDLSNNTSLTRVAILSNELSSINLSANAILDFLRLGGNQFTSIDISANTLLTDLDLSFNDFETVDVSNNTNLINLSLRANNISALDLSTNTLLQDLDIYSNDLSTLDLTNNTLLTSLNIGINSFNSIDLSSLSNLDVLTISSNPITNLDLSNNAKLRVLICSLTSFASLDLTTNVNLISFTALNSQLTELDFSNNTLLEGVSLTNNGQLTSINFKNGNNAILTNITITNNANLSCVQVDNATDANNGNGSYDSWSISPNIVYEEHCLDTYVPDDNFEQELINLGLDVSLDDYVPTKNIENVTSLNIDGSSIADLTGIEDFLALEDLRVRNNSLTSLDLTNNINLTSLRCNNNDLAILNLKNGNNGVLTTMRAENNSLTCIEVDDETAANTGSGSYSSWQVDSGTTFSENCSGCAEMDVIGNTISIVSGDNTPDVGDDTDFGVVNFGDFLERIFIIENTGTLDLNLTGSPVVEVSNSTDFTITSQPSTLVTANGGTTTFTVRYTPSMAGTINTAILSIANDDCDENPYVFYVEGQSATLGIEELEISNNVSIYPNPTNGKFTINVKNGFFIDKLKIYDINGRLIKAISNLTSPVNNISINELQGVYFLKIISDSKTTIKKLLVI